MITYGHEKFIEQSIEGVLMQEGNFEIELIISNDNSPDKTDEIIKKILQNHPKSKIIKYIRHEKNLGIIPNFSWTLQQAKGDYIALCEGDDYWTDPLKLQKQVDFLEKFPEYSMCFHSVEILESENNNFYPEKQAENRDYTIDELLLTKVAHTATFVFRTKFLETDVFLNKSVFGGDLILALSMAEKGKVFGMSQKMAVYRKHSGGITSQALILLGIDHYKRFIKQFIMIKKTFRTISRNAISIKIVDNCMTVCIYYAKKKNIKAIKYFLIALFYKPDMVYNRILKVIKKI